MADMTDDAMQYIESLENDRRREEARALDKIFRKVSGFTPRLWAGKMIGYGIYDYTYDSGHSGSSLATGFAVPDRQITFYIMPGYKDLGHLLDRLGPYRKGKACLYVTRLERIDTDVLAEIIRAGLDDLATRWAIRAE